MATQWIQAIYQALLSSLRREEVWPVGRLFLKDRKEFAVSPASDGLVSPSEKADEVTGWRESGKHSAALLS